jgi:hypothetical protein
LHCWPNPAQGTLNISFTAADAGKLTLTVYDALGQATTVRFQQELTTGTFAGSLSLETLAPGFYFFNIHFENVDGSVSETVRKISIIQ